MSIDYAPLVASARREAIRTYAAAYDRWAESEQVLVAEGMYADAQGAHEYAMWCLRAYRAELDDPATPNPDVPEVDERDGGRNDR